jgi:hypothetical protein
VVSKICGTHGGGERGFGSEARNEETTGKTSA